MAKRFDYIICLDLEATCWDEGTRTADLERQGIPFDPVLHQGDQVSEIIEFGVCKYAVESAEIYNKQSILVRPSSSMVSAYCTQLTGHTWEKLRKHGIPFDGALNRLRKEFGPKHRVMASWGNYDWYMVSEQCLREDKPFPFGRSHINVKEMHAVHRKLARALGLKAACDLEGLGFVGFQHRGDDDAYNVARVLKKLLTG